uniref:Uncharacterized protein n=1 Tax=Caenorhabditis japonica TaxID=281687 RepID=A0A8R1ELA8_CAEJA
MTLLYKIFIRPLVEYGTTVTSPLKQGDSKAIESVQNAFTRRLYCRQKGRYLRPDDKDYKSAAQSNELYNLASYYRVRVTHAALERRLVGISLSEQRQRNLHREDIRAQSEVRDPLLVIKKKKLGWAGHIMRRNDGRWTRLVQEWYPIGEKRPVGRPRMRWSDSLKEEISLFDGNHLKTHWSTIAKDRMACKAVIRDHIK